MTGLRPIHWPIAREATLVRSKGTAAALGKPVVPDVEIRTMGVRPMAPDRALSGARYGGKYESEDCSPGVSTATSIGKALFLKFGAVMTDLVSEVKTVASTSGSMIKSLAVDVFIEWMNGSPVRL